jgi:hypothetical protein
MQLKAQNESQFHVGFSQQKPGSYQIFASSFTFNNGIYLRSAIGAGVQRTFIQQRFEPFLSQSVGYSFSFFDYRVSLTPEITFSWNGYTLSKYTDIDHIGMLLGYNVTYGRKWRVFHAAGIGRGQEHTSFGLKTNYLGYQVTLGVSYVW